MAKRKMTAFKIHEISVVDRPAQEGARMLLMKRADDLLDEPLSKTTDVKPVNKLNPKEGDTDMSKEELDALQKKYDTDTKKQSDDLAKANAELAKAKKVSEMTDAEKAKFNAMDDTAKSAWLEKSAGDRAAIMKNDADANPVVYKNASGEEFRKNDDPRLITMAKAADEANKTAKSEKEARENSELKKRATEFFKHHPGTEDVKAAMLKSIEAIPDEEVRKKALESAAAGDKALAAAFTRKGAGGGTESEGKQGALDQIEKLAKQHATDHKMSYAKAYDAVLQTDVGKELYGKTIPTAA